MNERVTEQVWKTAEPLLTQEGMELVDVEFRRESHGTMLRLYVDRQGGVGLDDLARLSRQLGDVLDVHDTVPGPYTLEVSSPGIDRRLRRPEHFARYVGKKVRVKTVAPHDGRRVFVGALDAVGAEGITVADQSGSHFIRFAEIARANYQAELSGPRR